MTGAWSPTNLNRSQRLGILERRFVQKKTVQFGETLGTSPLQAELPGNAASRSLEDFGNH